MRLAITIGLFVLLLTACWSNTPQQRALYTGSDGIKMSFPQQNNFKQFTNETFSIAIRLENDGATTITKDNPAWVTALYDPATISFVEIMGPTGSPIQRPFPVFIAGRSRDVSLGEVTYLDATFKTLMLTSNRQTAKAPITFSICYPYNSIFIKNVCVDRDYFNTESTKICTAQIVTDSSQGAPVAVTSIEPRFSNQQGLVQPQFRIHIENLRDGYVLYKNTTSSLDVCLLGANFNKTEFGKAYIEASLNTVPLSCGTDNDNIVRFERNSADIVCRLETSMMAGANYETPLIINLRYFYISSLTANVEVNR